MTSKALSKTGHQISSHVIRTWKVPSMFVLGLLLLSLGGCKMLAPTLPEVVVEEAQVITHAIENDDQVMVIDDPWKLVEQAETAVESEAPALLIRAINEFIDRGQHSTAQSFAENLNGYSLTTEESLSLQVIHARLASAFGEHEQTIRLLRSLDYRRIQNIDTKKRFLAVLANSQIALGRLPDATVTMMDLDLIAGGEDKLENQRRLLRLLQTLDGLQISLLKELSSSPYLDGWLALSETLTTTTPALVEADFHDWRRLHPGHPAQVELLNQNVARNKLDDYRQIGILLPLTSPYGSAARAFYDGFMEAHNNIVSTHPPQIILYDTGKDSLLSSFYYQAAVNEGADFIVGPLGREAAEQLLTARQPELPTLLIADIPVGRVAENLYGISLSPEKEAQQIAEKAFADGHRQAAVFRSDSKWGDRVANAFVSKWQLLGGKVVKNSSFPNDVSDYTTVIQRFLGLDKSIARKSLLETQLNTNLMFTPRRNDDMSLLFLAANAEQSRLVVPQLRFFQAHDLPIYATSYVYSGNPNPAVDADLDGLVFGDMKWMLDGVARYKAKFPKNRAVMAAAVQTEETGTTESGEQLASSISAVNPYQNSTLNRIYALGLESYHLIPRLNNLRNNARDRFHGEAMTVGIDENGNVERVPVWAKFISGLAEPIDPIGATTPITLSP